MADTLALTYAEFIYLDPGPERLLRIGQKLGGWKEWKNKKITAKEARDLGVTFYDILWVAAEVAVLNKGVRNRLRLWVADCAAKLLPDFEKEYPSNDAPRKAIIAARQYARGEISTKEKDVAMHTAWVVAKDTSRDAAMDESNDAVCDASRAAWAAVRTTWTSTKDAVWDTAWEEEPGAFNRLIEWLSDVDIEDWPLPEIKESEEVLQMGSLIEQIKKVIDDTTPGPWFIHDFSDPVLTDDPIASDVVVSCTNPDHIGVASMLGGDAGPRDLGRARCDAQLIALAPAMARALIEQHAQSESVKR